MDALASRGPGCGHFDPTLSHPSARSSTGLLGVAEAAVLGVQGPWRGGMVACIRRGLPLGAAGVVLIVERIVARSANFRHSER